jgi:hypothetical protein
MGAAILRHPLFRINQYTTGTRAVSAHISS